MIWKKKGSFSTEADDGPPHPDELMKQSISSLEDQEAIKYRKNEERKATVKLDLIVMPILSMILFFSALDRSNIGNARVTGLQSDLKLSDHQFSIVLNLTSVSSILIKLPATIVLKRIGPHIGLPFITFCSGLVTFCRCFVTNFGGLATTGLFIGLAGGAFYPTMLLYLSQTYTSDQLQLRIAMLFSAATLSGSVSGLLSYAIFPNLGGTWGKPGWAWLFLLEGLATIAFAMSIAFIFPPSIKLNRWLNQSEKTILDNRLARKSSSPRVDEKEKFQISEVLAAITSPHVILVLVSQFMGGLATTSVQYFTPTIVHSLGYSPTKTQLMCAPPSVAAFLLILVAGYFSGRYQLRALTAGIGAALGLFGFIVFLIVDPSYTRVKYASLFLAIPGTHSMAPPIGAWSSSNSLGHYRKATSIALSIAAAATGGIVSSWLFPNSQAPKYHSGIIANLFCCASVIICVTLNFLWLRYSTKYKLIHRNKILEPYGCDVANPDSPEFERAWKELGDKHPDFQYVY